MDESFVMLQGLKGGRRGVDAGLTRGRKDLYVRASALEKIFALVEAEGDIEVPLCLECAGVLREELEGAVAEAEAEAVQYEADLADLLAREGETARGEGGTECNETEQEVKESNERVRADSLEDDDGAPSSSSSSSSAAGTEERWLKRIARLTEQLAETRAEHSSLDAAELEVTALEERYWQEHNDYIHQLKQHREARDAILARIEVTTSALEELRKTNVLNDAFHIWHDGPFATISGFRLGRYGGNGGNPVEWDEINAAWGQAVLLLSTLASACKFSFVSYRLVPMGSYSKIYDGKQCLELFGPVSSLNPFKRTNFDRAMVGYLKCLDELSHYANASDLAAGTGIPFALPYAIEGDKIAGRTIKLTFNREDKWTAALKCMLADLKCLLVWVARTVNWDGQTEAVTGNEEA